MNDRRQKEVPVAVEHRSTERRVKVNRRRQIDPTTCERDYSPEEVEFMSALDDYKRRSGRMFPTCSEILEVFKALGYEKRAELPTVAPLAAPAAVPTVGATSRRFDGKNCQNLSCVKCLGSLFSPTDCSGLVRHPPQSAARDLAKACKTVGNSRSLRIAVMLVGAGLTMAGGCTNFVANSRNADGVTLFQQGRYQDALQKFQEATYSDPSNADGYYNLGATYHRLGQLRPDQPASLEQAETCYLQCLERNPNHRDCHRGLAVL